MSDGSHKPERGPSKRLHFEDEAREDATLGQVGPKSKKRVYTFQDTPTSNQPDASQSVEDASATSGQHGPKSPNRKYRQHSEQARPSERLRQDDEPPSPDKAADTGSGPADKKAAQDGKRLNKSKLRAEKSGAKLDAAREKLAAQKPPKKPGPVKTAGRASRFQPAFPNLCNENGYTPCKHWVLTSLHIYSVTRLIDIGKSPQLLDLLA